MFHFRRNKALLHTRYRTTLGRNYPSNCKFDDDVYLYKKMQMRRIKIIFVSNKCKIQCTHKYVFKKKQAWYNNIITRFVIVARLIISRHIPPGLDIVKMVFVSIPIYIYTWCSFYRFTFHGNWWTSSILTWHKYSFKWIYWPFTWRVRETR